LLSDFPDLKVIRRYRVLSENGITASRSFFLIDPQGVVRRKWLIPDGPTTVVPSDAILQGIREVLGTKP
jgi:alkyl hydroperoxide reductase subunit AhpC